MTKTAFEPELPELPAFTLGPAEAKAAPLSRRGMATAVWTMFRLALARQCRARRMLVVLGLFALPVAFAVLARVYDEEQFDTAEVETLLVFYFIPHALVPLVALLHASGMVQDELEEQTLTYLLVRPLPRWTIYVGKLLATILITSLVAGVFTMATLAVINWGAPEFWSGIVLDRAPKTAVAMALALMAYCSLFGCLSLFLRRSLAVGVAYIIILEGVFANIPFIVREATVMYYFRVLCTRWLDLRDNEWSIDLETAPSASTCVIVLLVASLVLTSLAAFVFRTREFRVKTPEGS